MNLEDRKACSFSIVLIGNFSPCMFQPYWFKYVGILSDSEFNAVEKNQDKVIISNTITSFETENFVFRIVPKKFIVIAKKEPFELLTDVFGKLREKMDFVLVEKFGINYSFHVELGNPENLKQFGDILAPKKYWRRFFEGCEDDSENKSGLSMMGMRKITDFGCVNVKIEASSYFNNAVFFDYNYHFDGKSKEPFDMFDVGEIAEERMKQFVEYSNSVSAGLIKGVFENEC